MRKSILLFIALLFTSSTHAVLLERLGGLAYYDTEADLTWLADANYAFTSGYSTGGPSGRMIWADANNWSAGLSVAGISGWRLPESDACVGYNCFSSEMGNLFYNVLGNTAGTLSNSGPFSNVVRGFFWSATDYAPDPNNAWGFTFDNDDFPVIRMKMGRPPVITLHGLSTQVM